MAITRKEDHVHHSDDEESQFRITRPATRAEDEEDEEIRLRSLLTRARARAVESQSNLPLGSIYGIDVHGLQENELLWEIGCKVSTTILLVDFPEYARFIGRIGAGHGIYNSEENLAFL